MKTLHNRLVLCRAEDWLGCLSANLTPQGDALTLDVRAHTAGFVCLRAVDSGEAGFSWGRISIGCALPDDSLIRVYARASDTKQYGPWPELDAGLAGMTGDYAQLRAGLNDVFGAPVSADVDFYVGQSGRYLWLMLELVSTGVENPVLSSVTIVMSGDHMVDYLPAIYQDDGFTRRFLSVFDSVLMDMEREIYQLPGTLDYHSARGGMLEYLASWLGVDAEGKKRDEVLRRIAGALNFYEDMHTVSGVRASVERLTGRTPILIENASVDPNDPACPDPELYRKLYGDNPFRFFILLEEDTFSSRDGMERFLEQMKGLIPAGTELELVLLKKCVQLDWHTYLGVNSVIGSYIPVTIDENTTIHYDTMIGGH